MNPPKVSSGERWRRLALVAIVALGALLVALPIDARGRREGEEVIVSGSVVDAAGQPVGGATVEIRASRRAFSLRDFRVARRGSRRASATTDSRGNFEIVWSWHPYYTKFDLVAGVPDGIPGKSEGLHILAQTNLSRRMKRDSSVIATLEISDRSEVDSLNEFLAGLNSAAKRRVYHEAGKPDKVRVTEFPAYRETSWWFFEQGKVYIFKNGELSGVDDFEPIPQSSS